MIEGFEIARDILEEPTRRAFREQARALASQGRTVGEVARTLNVSPLTAWWLSDYRAEAPE